MTGYDVEKNNSVDTLQLLMGHASIEQGNVPGEILLLAKAIDDPYCLPFIIEDLDELTIEDENMFRFALLRVQIDSELRMNEDIQMHQRRRYVAQVIEKMIFGEMLIEPGAQFIE
jgi:hypothetical protein